jgi:hypothetical protein
MLSEKGFLVEANGHLSPFSSLMLAGKHCFLRFLAASIPLCMVSYAHRVVGSERLSLAV